MKMLRRIRKARGLSVAGLSKLTGIPDRNIRRYEVAETHPEKAVEPSWENAGKIADALNCTLGQLAGREPFDAEIPKAVGQ